MHEHARTYFIANLKKNKECSATGARLVLDLLAIFQTKMKNATDPRIEEIQIPREMTRWSPQLANLAGILVPDQEMVNRFTIELTRGERERNADLYPLRDRRPYRGPLDSVGPTFHTGTRPMEEIADRPRKAL